MGWSFHWVSSSDTDFNYDFNASLSSLAARREQVVDADAPEQLGPGGLPAGVLGKTGDDD
jgi:uncharacterized protein DUF899